MHLLPGHGDSWQQVHGHFARDGRRRRDTRGGSSRPDCHPSWRRIWATSPAKWPLVTCPGKEPQNDVLPLADQSVLPLRVMPHLALRPVKLLRVDLHDQPATVAQVPDQIGPTQEASSGIEELALQVVGRNAGVMAPQACVALGWRLCPPVDQRQPGDHRERSLAVLELTPDLRQVSVLDEALLQCAVQAGDRLVAGKRRQRLDERVHHRDHLAAVQSDGFQPGSVLSEGDSVPRLARAVPPGKVASGVIRRGRPLTPCNTRAQAPTAIARRLASSAAQADRSRSVS